MHQEGPWSPTIDASNRYQYNGIEYDESFGLNANFATFRTLDASIGRWWGVDPKAEYQYGLSPYNSMNNNPILHNDPNGDIVPIVALAVVAGVGGLLNLGTAALSGKVNSIGAGLGYFSSGAAGAGVALFNPYAGYGITVGGNLVTDIATGNVPDSDASPLSMVGYGVGLALSGLNATGAVKLVGAVSPITVQAAKVAFTSNYIQVVNEAGKTIAYVTPKDPFYTAVKEATGGGAKNVLNAAALEKSANATYISSKGIETGLTEAGRAVTKHPQLFGYESVEALQQVVRTDAALNKLGSEAIKNILQNGRFGIEFAQKANIYTIAFRLPGGGGARWDFFGNFVGFLSP